MFPIAAGVVDPVSPGGRPSSWAATGRSGGVSEPPFDSLNLAGYVGDDAGAVAVNRARVATLLGARPDRLAVMDSVHGADVAEVSAAGVVAGVDGLVTREAGLVLVALGADCVPLALIGDDDITVAVAHCGWRGLVAGIVESVVARMHARGAGVHRAIVGASVCGQCYPVPTERAEEVAASCPEPIARAALLTCADGQPGIDVAAGIRAQLRALGIDPAVVSSPAGCTVEDTGLFSYRRDGRTGRQGIAVVRQAMMDGS